VLKLLSDILIGIDAGDLSALVLLDLSADFDTVDHHILLQRLEHSCGITDLLFNGSSLIWLAVANRNGSSTSSLTQILCGVPHGSVLVVHC